MYSLPQLILLLGGWGAMISAFCYFVSKRIADKLNIKWKETADKNLAKLQSELNKNNAILNSLTSLHGTNYNLAQERRIKSIEVLWLNILEYERIIPSTAHLLYSCLLKSEFANYLTEETSHPGQLLIRDSLKRINENEHFNLYLPYLGLIEKEQPFLGEKIWNAFQLYKIFIGRVAILLLHESEKRKFQHWQDDSALHGLLQQSLDDKEMTYLYTTEVNSLRIACEFFKGKLLLAINSVLSGEAFSETALERIKRNEAFINIKTQ